jgi:hypothetical protein
VFLVGRDVFGIFMVGRRRMLNAQKTDPKRSSRNERKDTMKNMRNGASSCRKHDGGSDLGVGELVKRRASTGALRIMGAMIVM